MTTKIAFLIDSSRAAGVLRSNLNQFALSGTDSMLVGTIRHFESYPKFSVALFSTQEEGQVSSRLRFVKSFLNFLENCENLKIEVAIFVAKSSLEQIDNFAAIKTATKLIAWAHNTPSPAWLDVAYRSPSIQYLIAVSNVQKSQLAHHKIYEKTVVLPNYIETRTSVPFENTSVLSKNQLSFIGALVPAKGFHLLAEVWPSIHRKFPDWELVVCGSSGLYGNHASIGAHGLAEKSYEARFMQSLGSDLKEANALGVKFLGSVSKADLYDQIRASRAVIVNPNTSGSKETFCMSAVEALLLGKPVIGGRAGGLLETVGHRRGGLLSRNLTELKNNIELMITNEGMAHDLGCKGSQQVLDRYDRSMVLERWEQMLNGTALSAWWQRRPNSLDFFLRSAVRRLMPQCSLPILRHIKKNLRNLRVAVIG